MHVTRWVQSNSNTLWLLPPAMTSLSGVRDMPMLFRNSTGSMPLSWSGSSISLWNKNIQELKLKRIMANRFRLGFHSKTKSQLETVHTWQVRGGRLVPPQWGTCSRPGWFWRMKGCWGTRSPCWGRSVWTGLLLVRQEQSPEAQDQQLAPYSCYIHTSI